MFVLPTDPEAKGTRTGQSWATCRRPGATRLASQNAFLHSWAPGTCVCRTGLVAGAAASDRTKSLPTRRLHSGRGGWTANIETDMHAYSLCRWGWEEIRKGGSM